MNNPKKIIAILGKPNVGKSTIFNRIIQSRESIVNKQPGVTRDRIYGEFEWRNNEYIIIDTGGIQVESASFQKEINLQANLAISEADIIIFMVNQKLGPDKDDFYIAKLLKNSNKPIIMCANKTDNPEEVYTQNHHWEKFGIKPIFYVCATHGINIGDLLNYLIKNFPSLSSEEVNIETTFSLVGKPNVGKSSLINAIFNEYKVNVSEIPGTTRDSIYLKLLYKNKNYQIIDTAGIKRVSKLPDEIDQIGLIKTKLAIERSKIICLVLDGNQPLSSMDLNIASLIQKSTKPMVILVNKSDLLKNNDRSNFEKIIKHELNFSHNVQTLFVSALNKNNIEKIFPSIENVQNDCKRKWTYNELNSYLNNLELTKPPHLQSGRRIKIYEIKQVNTNYQLPIFQLLVDDPKYMPANYHQFLINKFENHLKITYTPLKIVLKARSRKAKNDKN